MTAVTSDRASYYADPLVYHVLHLSGTSAETRVFERIARRHAPGAASGPLHWLEPASGTGRYLHALAQRGHTGVGVDLLEPMNRFAAEEAQRLGVGGRLRFLTAPMESFDVPQPSFHAALNPINSVRHLMTDKAVLAHLACVRRALRPRGVYIVGVEVNPPGIAQPSEDVWKGRIAGLSVHQFVSYVPPEGRSRRETAMSHKTVITGRGRARHERHIDSVYHLRTYTKPQWEKILRAGGWSVVACYGPTGRPKAFEPVGYCLQVLRPQDR
ncbi:MAG TPA: class I SAM-dependent methyltransferase [Phycisphaerales bacterium]|nr:class I SAM-dependent methyltransferase [Phycisphaerales bacterium]